MQSQRLIQHTGSAELTIEGKNLKDTLRLLHDGIEYTPLSSTENSVTFILGDNGTNRIYVNGDYSFGVQISGIVIPEGLPVDMQMAQKSSKDRFWTPSDQLNPTGFRRVSCMNYPYKVAEGYTNFILQARYSGFDAESAGFHNCSLNSSEVEESVFNLNVKATDVTKPAYITYQGFIISVFNYTT